MQTRQEQLNQIVFHGEIDEATLCALMVHPEIDLKSDSIYVLTRCAIFQFNCALELAIPLSDPLVNNSEALSQAAQMGNIRGVQLLLPVSDALANNSRALQNANISVICVPASTQKKQRSLLRCFEVLYRASDPLAALHGLKQRGVELKHLQELEQRIAYDLKYKLDRQLGGKSQVRQCKKI